MKRFLALVLALTLPALPAAAEPVVVEIFASQNCAKCPRAFRNLKAIAKKEDILPLTWSVDYWDYLGGEDPMALPESTERQNVYVERFELRGPYTPQFVFDGALQCPGTRKGQISSWVKRRQKTDRADVSVNAVAGSVTISGAISLPRDVLLVHYLADYEGDMPNPVVKLEKLGEWSGGDVTFSTDCDNGCALLVQEINTGEILSAAVMP